MNAGGLLKGKKMSDVWNKTMAVTFLACAVAVLFPPHGWQGESFDRFAFVLSDEVYLTGRYGHLIARIAWKLLAAEIVVFLFVGLAAGFFLSSRR